MSQSYKDTVFLPSTSFSLHGNLPTLEQELLAYWDEIGLQGRLLDTRKDCPLFVLHDGPPYANGHLHMGHAFNKSLKDIIVRFRQMAGHRTPVVHGWDCHGLPIEAKVEEQYRKQNLSRDDIHPITFRQACRDYAKHWVEIQKEEVKRLGCLGRWDKPYTTMTPGAEAQIVKEFATFFMKGSIYLGKKPVMWSVVEKTALAEAELEYQDRVATSIYVGFPVSAASDALLQGARVLIWTTTPWTIPANRAIAYHPDITYALLETDKGKLVVAEALLAEVSKACNLENITKVKTFPGGRLQGVICNHPFYASGYTFPVPLLEADYVTTDAGTGLVHVAPGHGPEDFALGMAHNLEIPETVAENGLYTKQVPVFAGTHIFKADQTVLPALRESGCLLGEGSINHSYPHSWRSKAPLVFRTTPQWFLRMDHDGLREKLLKDALPAVTWHPENSQNRIQSMIEGRPDWCLSRQRVWGVPIPVFLNKATGQPLKDKTVLDNIIKAFEAEGTDIWFDDPCGRFLPPSYKAEDYVPVGDILDVWFDSGCTHAFVLENDPELRWPADVYVEGSDQHRGWFQSSLIVAYGTRGAAPYRHVVTHGFIVNDQGDKMSKSLGNTMDLQETVAKYGADLLRLWVAASDATEDLRIGPQILKQQEDVYRRFRNTFRYLLGSLKDTPATSQTPYPQLPDLERWILHRLYALNAQRIRCDAGFQYHQFIAALHAFCATDLSAFYFDIRKDSLYCDGEDSPLRKAVLHVMRILFDCLAAWLAPVLCFTAEEAWQARYKEMKPADSVHLTFFPDIPDVWHAPDVETRITSLRDIRRVITGALERARTEGVIKSSLQGSVRLFVHPTLREKVEGFNWAEFSITSAVIVETQETFSPSHFSLEDVKDVAVAVEKAVGIKCERCWKVQPLIETIGAPLCARCHTVLKDRC